MNGGIEVKLYQIVYLVVESLAEDNIFQIDNKTGVKRRLSFRFVIR